MGRIRRRPELIKTAEGGPSLDALRAGILTEVRLEDSDLSRLPIIYVPKVPCPICGAPKLLAYGKHKAEGDGSQSRYRECPGCGERFVIVEDPLEEGSNS